MDSILPGSKLPLPDKRAHPCLMQSHQISGSCSAQPACGLWIASSVSGWVTDPRLLPLCPSMTESLTDELPISIPKNSIISLLSLPSKAFSGRSLINVFVKKRQNDPDLFRIT